MGVKVLSLFDGMACGMLAMQRAGIEVDEYNAYEIDKYAIKTATHNFPMIKQHGDVFSADFTQYKDVDYVIGGSPCTYWSIAQKNNRETEASGIGWELFSQYIRAIKEAQPEFFIYENNKSMSSAIRESITNTFGFEPICINSALVSAQNRQRLYWVGKRNCNGTYDRVDIEQPEDRGIFLNDILNGLADREKSRAIIGSIGRTTTREHFIKNQGQMSFEPVGKEPSEREVDYMFRKEGRTDYGYIQRSTDEKSKCIIANISKGVPYNVLFQRVEAIGDTSDGKSRTIKAQYYKNGMANFVTNGGHEATAVAEPVNMTVGGKAQCLRASYYKDGIRNIVGNDIDRRTGVAEPVRVGALPRPNGELSESQGFRIYSTEGKSVGLKGNAGGSGGKTGLYAIPVEFDNDKPTKAISYADGKTYTVYEVRDGEIEIKGKKYPIKLPDGYYIIRKLTVSECKRLQTVPESYEFPVSDSQAYKMLGNGWTVDVIAYLLEHTKI